MEVVNAVLKTKDNGTGQISCHKMQNCYKLPVGKCLLVWMALTPETIRSALDGNSFWVRAVKSILGWWLMWRWSLKQGPKMFGCQ